MIYIVVNGNTKAVEPRLLTYGDIVELAGKPQRAGYTVTWRQRGQLGGGTLRLGAEGMPEHAVQARDGLVFNITDTSNS